MTLGLFQLSGKRKRWGSRILVWGGALSCWTAGLGIQEYVGKRRKSKTKTSNSLSREQAIRFTQTIRREIHERKTVLHSGYLQRRNRRGRRTKQRSWSKATAPTITTDQKGSQRKGSQLRNDLHHAGHKNNLPPSEKSTRAGYTDALNFHKYSSMRPGSRNGRGCRSTGKRKDFSI